MLRADPRRLRAVGHFFGPSTGSDVVTGVVAGAPSMVSTAGRSSAIGAVGQPGATGWQTLQPIRRGRWRKSVCGHTSGFLAVVIDPRLCNCARMSPRRSSPPLPRNSTHASEGHRVLNSTPQRHPRCEPGGDIFAERRRASAADDGGEVMMAPPTVVARISG